jgi:hypothetical protein
MKSRCGAISRMSCAISVGVKAETPNTAAPSWAPAAWMRGSALATKSAIACDGVFEPMPG